MTYPPLGEGFSLRARIVYIILTDARKWMELNDIAVRYMEYLSDSERNASEPIQIARRYAGSGLKSLRNYGYVEHDPATRMWRAVPSH